PLGRPIAMMSFALNHAASGFSPTAYKITNLAIHAVNALLVYLIALRLFASPALAGRVPVPARQPVAVLGAAAWAVHPLNLTAVLYIVQRMTSLSASFTLAGVLWYLVWRQRYQLRGGSPAMLLGGLLLWTALAAMTKENGALLPVFAALCELVLYRPAETDRRQRRVLDTFFALVVLLPALAFLALPWLAPDWLAGQYQLRSFTPGERVLTEARVLWFYTGLLLAPHYARFAIFHDDFPISTALTSPPTTLLAVLGIAFAVVLAWRWRARAPLAALAVGWFFAAHALESTFLGLELVHEHRNYVAIVVPVLALVCCGWVSAGRLARHRRALRLLLCGWLLLLGMTTWVRSQQWSDPVTLALAGVQHHPDSYRSQYELARIYYGLYERDGDPRAYERAGSGFARAAQLDPHTALPYFALVQHAYRGGHAPGAGLIREFGQRLRHGRMAPSIPNAFRNLVICAAAGRCPLPADVVMDLFGQALANATLAADARAALLTQLAAYYANALGDPQGGAAVLRELVAEYPDSPHHRLNLVRLLIAAGQLDAARIEIDAAAERIDRQHSVLKFRALRAEVRQLAEELRAAAAQI
ncbi:MAG: tetratricopeptide repeat protein, partial [Gammaproteobacteria bacterium]|nr:tetratricopeptide repeat protein [Gammaproteobacteria bacterium]